jgi:hypothetical protein
VVLDPEQIWHLITWYQGCEDWQSCSCIDDIGIGKVLLLRGRMGTEFKTIRLNTIMQKKYDIHLETAQYDKEWALNR